MNIHHKRLLALVLSLILFSSGSGALCATLGPATTYDELRNLLASAALHDTILVSGEIAADDNVPLSTAAQIKIKSADGQEAVIRGLRLRDASITFSDIHLEDSLTIDGNSEIQLSSDVFVSGSAGLPGLSFSGNGVLIIDRNCEIQGGSESAGVSIEHEGGEFYSSIEGSVRGGNGETGGPGVVISPLKQTGAIMITGEIQGGSGSAHGGHALNLYSLSGNAYITVEGSLRGGDGAIGGDGIQLVSASDNVSVGIGGTITGGSGENYGGDALILMNAEDAASFHLSGAFSGGDALGPNAQPGTSLQLVGDSASSRTRVVDCILEDGRQLSSTPEPTIAPAEPVVTPLPEITASVEDVDALATPVPIPSPASEPTAEPLPDAANIPTPDAVIEPTAEPTIDATTEPTSEPADVSPAADTPSDESEKSKSTASEAS